MRAPGPASHGGEDVGVFTAQYVRLSGRDIAVAGAGRAAFPADADGDAHSSQYDDERRLLFSADEGFCRAAGPGIEKGLGCLRVWDFADPQNVRQIGSFRTPRSAGTDDQAAGDYTIHDNFLVGHTLYRSWSSDGVQVVDVSDPTRPRRVAYFVPPAATNPVKPSQRGVLTNTAQVWGVVDEGTLAVSST